MALFQSYAVIYLAIGAAIHEVLFVFYSYPNDDTEALKILHYIDCMQAQRVLHFSASFPAAATPTSFAHM